MRNQFESSAGSPSSLTGNTRDGRQLSVYFFAVFVSVLLSLWISLRETVINPDAICYLQSAADIGVLGLKAAAQLCDQAKWPFYSALIYSVVKLTHLSFTAAAFLLDGVFSVISVITFIYIIQLLGGSRRLLWLAAAVILLAHEFDSVREYIVRDHGFWAFYLLSIVFLLQYLRTLRVSYALLWSLSLVVATLFRIEGTLFLLLMPLSVWFYSGKNFSQRLQMFSQLNMLTLLILLGLLMMPQHLGRLVEVRSQLSAGLQVVSQNFHVNAQALAQHVLKPDAVKDAGLVLFLLLLVWYGFNVVANLSLVYVFLIIYAWVKKALILDKSSQLVLWGYALVNVAVTAIFMTENMFISKRYLIALSLVLMLWVPFALEKLVQLRKQRAWLVTGVAVLMLANFLGAVINFGYSKTYIHAAGDWLAQNVPAQATLYSNDEQVMYYSRHFGDEIFAKAHIFADMSALTQGQWKQYDYLALRLNKLEAANVPAEINVSPAKVFANRRGDEVVIYKILH
jgi:hypothetical protein